MRIGDLSSHRVGVLQAGGLSSLALGLWLRERGVDSHHYVADLGQSPPEELAALVASLRSAGLPTTVVDLRPRMATVALELLRYQARHDGGYWNSTGASRLVLVERLSATLRADHRTVLAHGSVGGGNDERRFARYAARLAPDLGVYAPWTDPDALARFPDRIAMLAAVSAAGLWLDPGSDADRSTDACLAGASHESAALENLATALSAGTLTARWGVWPADAPAEPETLTVAFARGWVNDVAGSGPDPVSCLVRAHWAGARYGVWLRDVVERRIIGTHCRGVYEAPGLEVLDAAWQRALQLGLDRPARELYDVLARVVGTAVYEGRYLEPVSLAARAALAELTATVTATVTLTLHPGAARVAAAQTFSVGTDRETRFASGGNRWREPVAAARPR